MQIHEYDIYDENSFQLALLSIKTVITDFGFNDVKTARFLTMTSELARNILKYAIKGKLTLTQKSDNGRLGLELYAQDQGPGIIDINNAMQDNVSTGGTLGQGLPGAKRLVDEFSITSEVGHGTKIRAIIWM